MLTIKLWIKTLWEQNLLFLVKALEVGSLFIIFILSYTLLQFTLPHWLTNDEVFLIYMILIWIIFLLGFVIASEFFETSDPYDTWESPYEEDSTIGPGPVTKFAFFPIILIVYLIKSTFEEFSKVSEIVQAEKNLIRDAQAVKEKGQLSTLDDI